MFGTLAEPANWVVGITVFLVVFIALGLAFVWTEKR